MKFAIFGAGAWGTALAIHIAKTKHEVYLVPRRAEHAHALIKHNENYDYLKGFSLDNIKISINPEEAFTNANVIFLACPSHALNHLCHTISQFPISHHKTFITLCKGLDLASLLPPASIVKKSFPKSIVGVLSGPNNAQEIAAGKPAATTLAIENHPKLLLNIQSALSSPSFRIYSSTDVTGVEYAGCLKNIYAIGSGICEGLKLGDNARASYLTRALKELCDIGQSLGGNPSTFLGLSGFGDLIATSFGSWSRNRSFGQAIAEGSSPESTIKSQITVVEGYYATKTFHQLLSNKNIEAPILNQLFLILYENKPPHHALTSLMTRLLKPEIG